MRAQRCKPSVPTPEAGRPSRHRAPSRSRACRTVCRDRFRGYRYERRTTPPDAGAAGQSGRRGQTSHRWKTPSGQEIVETATGRLLVRLM
jgi:hypothetical protein